MCNPIPQPHLSQNYHGLLVLTDASRPMGEVDEQGTRDATTSKDQGGWNTTWLCLENAATESVQIFWIKTVFYREDRPTLISRQKVSVAPSPLSPASYKPRCLGRHTVHPGGVQGLPLLTRMGKRWGHGDVATWPAGLWPATSPPSALLKPSSLPEPGLRDGEV